jgi:hypothetical protein
MITAQDQATALTVSGGIAPAPSSLTGVGGGTTIPVQPLVDTSGLYVPTGVTPVIIEQPAPNGGKGGCVRCGGGVTSPNPMAGVPVAKPGEAPAASPMLTLAGLPWWVWVLGLVAVSAAFSDRR